MKIGRQAGDPLTDKGGEVTQGAERDRFRPDAGLRRSIKLVGRQADLLRRFRGRIDERQAGIVCVGTFHIYSGVCRRRGWCDSGFRD